MKTNVAIEKILNDNGIDTSKMDRKQMNLLASNLFMAASPKVRQDTVKKQKENDKKLKTTQDRRKKAIFTELKPILSKFADELLDIHLNSPKGHKAKSSFSLGTIGKYSREIKLDITIQKKNNKAKQVTK